MSFSNQTTVLSYAGMTDRTEEEKVKTLHVCYVAYIVSNCAETCMQMFPYGRKKNNQPINQVQQTPTTPSRLWLSKCRQHSWTIQKYSVNFPILLKNESPKIGIILQPVTLFFLSGRTPPAAYILFLLFIRWKHERPNILLHMQCKESCL